MSENKYITSILIKDEHVSVDLLKIIRMYRKDAYSSIKKDIQDGKYVLSCSTIDLEQYTALLDCYKELKKAGAHIELYENGRMIDDDLAKNWLNSMRDTRDYLDTEPFEEEE
ncbi:MAG: hypothetical protein IKE21_01280 [Erysipelotrichaceae bacterium]|nr:hypothetical protein [Erysipelotrichaceae bacterium]